MSVKRCMICKRQLRGAESIARGIGSTCFRRLTKLINEDKAKAKARREAYKRKVEVEKGQIDMFEGMGESE